MTVRKLCGKMRIINAHTHVLKKPAWGIKRGNINDLIKDMKKSKISKCLVFSGTGEPYDYALKELIDKFKDDGRFELIFTLDLSKSDIKPQVRQIESYLKKKLIRGVKILLGYYCITPDSKKLEPVYKLCEKYGCPAIFHTGDTLDQAAKLYYTHPLHIDSLAVNHPKLKIIIAHIGNPWFIDAAEVVYKNKNVYGDVAGFFLDFSDKRYNDLIRRKVNDFIAFAGGNKLLFGTDFPLVDSANYLKFVKSLNLTKEELKSTLYKNAEELFKLSES